MEAPDAAKLTDKPSKQVPAVEGKRRAELLDLGEPAKDTTQRATGRADPELALMRRRTSIGDVGRAKHIKRDLEQFMQHVDATQDAERQDGVKPQAFEDLVTTYNETDKVVEGI